MLPPIILPEGREMQQPKNEGIHKSQQQSGSPSLSFRQQQAISGGFISAGNMVTITASNTVNISNGNSCTINPGDLRGRLQADGRAHRAAGARRRAPNRRAAAAAGGGARADHRSGAGSGRWDGDSLRRQG